MKKQDTVKLYIKDRIGNKWNEGDKIFSETQLMTYCHVSRITAREAIKSLCEEEVLETRKGSGTFVKNIKKEEYKKYIIILTSINAITGPTNYIYSYFIELLKEIITEKGYTPICYVGDENLTLEINFKEILDQTAGVLSVWPLDKDLDVIDRKGINIVSCLQIFYTEYPSVAQSYKSFFSKLNILIQKYSLNDNLFFLLKHRTHHSGVEIASIQKYYYSKYNMVSFPISYEHNMKNNPFRIAMKSLKKIPDSIIFLDDTIYIACQPLFPEFDHILKNTKIITQSSGNLEWGNRYKICRIEIDIKKVAEEAVNLLDKRIKGEFLNKFHIYIDAKVINEEIFKN